MKKVFILSIFLISFAVYQINGRIDDTGPKRLDEPTGKRSSKIKPKANSEEADPFSDIKLSDLELKNIKPTPRKVDSSLLLGSPRKTVTSKSTGPDKAGVVGFSVKPHEELLNEYKDNDGDLKKTLKEVDLARPPIQAEMTIQF